jgi:hypothetical protein
MDENPRSGFDKFAGSKFEHRSITTMAPEGRSIGICSVFPPPPHFNLLMYIHKTSEISPIMERKPYWWVEPMIFWGLAIILALGAISALVQKYF